ncbi:MAG: hypothetical protein JXN59_17675 [Anaerolineae bacterium]|nr:hypothetical protein [Anaerolineae bacterium]
MSNPDMFLSDYDEYDDLYNPARSERKARRQRRPLSNPKDRKPHRETAASVADLGALESGFETTYRPSRHEEGWLLESLKPFYEMALMVDVLAVVKGGKEASVYRCEGHPDTGRALAAAKVYRPRMFRNLRRDHVYRQGRDILTPDGRPVGLHGERVAHAVQKKTSYGQKAAHTSWLMYEYTTLETLYNAGAAVPEPYAAAPNAILMGYCGDEGTPAPTLHEVTLEPEEVVPLFDEIMHNVDLMLQHDVIHGDLSAYNILYWAGAITLIDFPQVVSPRRNRQAYDILGRDLMRVCDHFAGYGLARDPQALLEKLWRRCGGQTPAERDADEARFWPEPEVDDD